jgi:chemotaxis family two-component system sensor kinase Cph1
MPSEARNALARPQPPATATGRRSRSERVERPQEVSDLGARVVELERDYARLERFAAIAAHELCEPLVTTEAYATLLLERLGNQVDPESRSDLEALSRSAARMRLLVETLLHLARSDISMAREAVALSEVVNGCLDLLDHEIRRRRARVVVRPLPKVPGDPALLATVLRNLLSNALRYGPRENGTIRIAASRARSASRISVVSEGKTIGREDRRRIFYPFERGGGERRSEGLGLGLAISRQIVERHGGVIGVEPCPRGNRFYFTIPD